MTTTGQDAALEPIEGFVDALDRALADPGWDGSLPDPPDLEAAVPLAVQDLPAARSLLARAEATSRALAERLAEAGAELDRMAPRRSAARSYAQHDGENFAPNA